MKLARLPNGQPEIFHTIQGEGRNSGLPSVFVRASLCNLYCRWCDTDYTWNWEGTNYRHDRDDEPGYTKYRKSEQMVEFATEEIADRIAAFDCRNVVLTGGEPLIQQREWVELVGELKGRDPLFTFEVETNGTVEPKSELIASVDRFNVSPKLKNSGVELNDRRKAGALKTFAALESADFKFVIDSEVDLDELRELVAAFAIPATRVFLMPQGISAEALSEKSDWLIDICKGHEFRYSDRLHVRLWGDQRGV